MKGNLVTRIVVIVVITLFAGYFLIPTVNWWGLPQDKKALWEKTQIMAPAAPSVSSNAVRTNAAVRSAVRTNTASASNVLAGLSTNDTMALIEEQRQIDKLRSLKAKVIKLGLDLQGGMHIVLEADLAQFKSQKDKEDAINRALEIVRNRIDQFGVSEPGINRQGADRVVVQLPGVRDPKRAQELLRAEGSLDFKLVNDEMSKPENFADYKKGILKPGVSLADDEEILFLWNKNPDSGKLEQGDPIVLKKNPPVTGKSLKTAQVGFSQFQEPEVEFEMKPDGAKLFYEFTSVNVGKRLAIVLDNKVRSAPTIRDKLSDRGVITGSFSIDEAKDLALILRAGALPVKMTIVEQRIVGPSLGRDSINAGFKAGWIACLLVFVFMLVYYKMSGLLANAAVILNVFLTIGVLAGLGFTLTLPGIAGLILTIGMAVDANVIIMERIREELRAGKTPVGAIEAGYDRAFITVFDANITTLLVAIVLFQFGTGAIKGFAVTLFIGIVANLFTGVYVTRSVYMYFTQKVGLRRVSI